MMEVITQNFVNARCVSNGIQVDYSIPMLFILIILGFFIGKYILKRVWLSYRQEMYIQDRERHGTWNAR